MRCENKLCLICMPVRLMPPILFINRSNSIFHLSTNFQNENEQVKKEKQTLLLQIQQHEADNAELLRKCNTAGINTKSDASSAANQARVQQRLRLFEQLRKLNSLFRPTEVAAMFSGLELEISSEDDGDNSDDESGHDGENKDD